MVRVDGYMLYVHFYCTILLLLNIVNILLLPSMDGIQGKYARSSPSFYDDTRGNMLISGQAKR